VPLTNVVANGLLFQYAVAPGTKPTPLIWSSLAVPGTWLSGESGDARNGEGFRVGVDAGFTVSRALCETPLQLTLIVAVVSVVTEDAVAVKVAELKPAGTLIRPGTWTAELSLVIVSATPPVGAAPVKLSVAAALLPPVSASGLSVNELGASGVPGGTTVTVAVWVTPLYVAVIVTG
jgi:hypothetical protein